MTTITTVGYGDVFPKEPFGKLIGTVTQVTGVLVIAVVVTIIAGNFESAHSQMKITNEAKRLKRLVDFAEWKQLVIDTAGGMPSQLQEAQAAELLEKRFIKKSTGENSIDILKSDSQNIFPQIADGRDVIIISESHPGLGMTNQPRTNQARVEITESGNPDRPQSF